MSRISQLVGEILALDPIAMDDEDVKLEVRAPATEEDMRAIRDCCNGRLPAELDELLSLAGGFGNGPLDFQPEAEVVGYEGLGVLLRASHYGNGDGFAIEPSQDRCRVWWVGHDPWFIVYWAPSIEAFLDLWLERAKALARGELDLDRIWKPVYRSIPLRPEHADAVAGAFFRQLPHDAVVHDLRAALPGTEIPFERLRELASGGTVRKEELLLGFLASAPIAVQPVPASTYDGRPLNDSEQAILEALPAGALVIHERDMPRGGYMDLTNYPEGDVGFRPPFHILYPTRS